MTQLLLSLTPLFLAPTILQHMLEGFRKQSSWPRTVPKWLCYAQGWSYSTRELLMCTQKATDGGVINCKFVHLSKSLFMLNVVCPRTTRVSYFSLQLLYSRSQLVQQQAQRLLGHPKLETTFPSPLSLGILHLQLGRSPGLLNGIADAQPQAYLLLRS